ncbi:pentapeptide repeat-containing protein [Nonomuraea sp. NPDC001831]|uniref:pentapeptide repeat-containing protein n=1 Tax=Nonomuraea sp. NPDC001831 TaxID=3364340 RepID=UPI003692B38A
MDLFPRSPRPFTQPPELRPPRSMWWWALPAALLIGAAAWGTAAWLLQDLGKLPPGEQISARIEAFRTALAAAAGMGAAVTLLLAVRRQRHQELTAAHTAHDAAERRVTELYTKAVEQLGNEQAPVRLGGLHALERLAQDAPALRQTVVDVICAYLRMPYTPPADGTPPAEPASTSASARRDPHEERQVRLTAQRILAEHMRYHRPASHRWWQSRPADPSFRHWPDMHLDLVGATLIDFNIGSGSVGSAWFDDATFIGAAVFNQVTFIRDAGFGKAHFTDDASFYKATFTRRAFFGKATFSGEAAFSRATFHGPAGFENAAFAGTSSFSRVTFTNAALFAGATGLERAELDRVRLAPVADALPRVWPLAWHVEETADGWQTLQLASGPEDGQLSKDGGPGSDRDDTQGGP